MGDLAKPDVNWLGLEPRKSRKNKELTSTQYRTIFRGLMNVKQGKPLEHGMRTEDYMGQVDYGGDIDTGKYLESLLIKKNIPKDLLKLLPRIEY